MNNPRKIERAYIEAVKRHAKLKNGKTAVLEFYKIVVDDWVGEEQKRVKTTLAIYDNIEDALNFVKVWNDPSLYHSNANMTQLRIRLSSLAKQVEIKKFHKRKAEERRRSIFRRRNEIDKNNEDNQNKPE